MDKKNDGIFRSMGYVLCKCEIKEICVYFYGHPKRWTNHKYAHVWADLGRVAILCNNLDAPDGGIALSAATRANMGKQKAFVPKSINAKKPRRRGLDIQSSVVEPISKYSAMEARA